MKTKVVIGCMTCLVSFSAWSQQGEMDDLYFNSRDRAKLNEKQAAAEIATYRKVEEQNKANATINPTDSYSARNINPEYSTQSNVDNTADQAADDSYFVSDYQPTGVNQNLSKSSGYYNNYNPYSSAYSNPYYGNYASGFSPYGMYGSMYNPYSAFSPYSSFGYPYGGFYQPGLSMSMGYGFGGFYPGLYSSMAYGMGAYGFNSLWNPYYGYGSGYYGMGGGYYGYPSVVVVNNGDNGSTVHGRRPMRSSSVNNVVDNTRQTVGYTRNDGRTSSSGRTATSGRTSSNASPAYYQSNWRRTTQPSSVTTRSSFWNNVNNNAGVNPQRNTTNRSNFNNWGNQVQQQRSFDNMSNRPQFGGGSMGGFSGGSRGHSSGGGGGGGTRGRNN